MKMVWSDSPTHYRCTSSSPVQIKARNFGGFYDKKSVTDMGYILPRDGRFMACIYGSINPDAPGRFFDNIDDAKAYVEQQALVGIAINKLTR